MFKSCCSALLLHGVYGPNSPFLPNHFVLYPQIVEPVEDIDMLLSRMCCVLAPSLWLEAWGMVVTEASLRGLPTIVSDAGKANGVCLWVRRISRIYNMLAICQACFRLGLSFQLSWP